MRQRTITALLALALGVSACAYYDDYGYQAQHPHGRDFQAAAARG